MISTAEIKEIIDYLQCNQHRSTTRRNYYSVWKKFNEFFVRLDRKPDSWEQRILLFTAHLIRERKQSSIKAILHNIKVKLNEDTCLLNSLPKACRLANNSTVRLRLPIQCAMLNVILKMTQEYFLNQGQMYLNNLYLSLFSTAYFGLFRVGELTKSDHTVKARDVHIGINKNKLLFVLRSSKNSGSDNKPQLIKIESSTPTGRINIHNPYCPYSLLHKYIDSRKTFKSDDEQFFVFSDRSAVKPYNFRKVFKHMIE